MIELLIYMLLAVIVLTIIAAILINSLRAENTVRTSAEATDTAQLAAQSLNRGIHNASAIEVSAPVADVAVVRTRSLDSSSEGVWQCQAWVVVDGQLRTTRSDAAIPVPTTAAEVASWLLVAEGVAPIGTDPIFSLAADERSLAVGFTVANGSGIPVTLDTTIISKQPIPATGKVTAPCF
ncbi:PilW family protein [Yonghaparkia sp. Root332]|uniref:PilW family protein n=1 Tax=Yonghaparkia sp. Root332 TaxID=1736516 RepID=UPI0012E3822C|nr:hypothetical protein [Yonghaparkia sp. Root332]